VHVVLMTHKLVLKARKRPICFLILRLNVVGNTEELAVISIGWLPSHCQIGFSASKPFLTSGGLVFALIFRQ
jgi:hypothetical protein